MTINHLLKKIKSLKLAKESESQTLQNVTSQLISNLIHKFSLLKNAIEIIRESNEYAITKECLQSMFNYILQRKPPKTFKLSEEREREIAAIQGSIRAKRLGLTTRAAQAYAAADALYAQTKSVSDFVGSDGALPQAPVQDGISTTAQQQQQQQQATGTTTAQQATSSQNIRYSQQKQDVDADGDAVDADVDVDGNNTDISNDTQQPPTQQS